MHWGLVTVPVATLAGWIGGAAWYGILGKQWSAALGWDRAEMKKNSPLLPLLFSFAAELVMALILYRVMGPLSGPRLIEGLLGGATLWLGFVVTTTGVNYAFQRKSLALLAIDAGHWLLVLLIQGGLIGGLR